MSFALTAAHLIILISIIRRSSAWVTIIKLGAATPSSRGDLRSQIADHVTIGLTRLVKQQLNLIGDMNRGSVRRWFAYTMLQFIGSLSA